MSKTLYNYRFFCIDEQEWETAWGFSPPTNCPDNANHTIDPDSITIIDQISTNVVQVQNSLNNTKGHYMLEGIHYTIPAQSNYTYIKQFPVNTACYAVYCYTSMSNIGDTISAFVPFPPEKLQDNISIGTSNFIISSALQTLMDPGRVCFLYSSSNQVLENLGKVIYTGSNNIVTQYATSNEYTSNDYIRTRAYFVDNVYIPQSGKYTIGGNILNGVFIPVNAPVNIEYKNSNSQEKDITFHIEYTF